MKRINIIYIAFLTLISVSCDSFLDETPDNRAEVDSQVKIRKLLVSAYPDGNYGLACELSSDNIDDTGEENPNTNRLLEQFANWQDVTESDNDDLENVWEGAYKAIASANEALSAIEKIGDASLLPEKGEALMARAFSHFILVNVFCKHYNANTSSTDLGIPYMEKSETTLNPQYKRGTVKEVYEKINMDIEVALPLISDDLYEVPLYHFNKKAAYAFAARFNLYYEQWQKAIDYANVVLPVSGSSSTRDWEALGLLPRQTDVVENAYINDPSNLLAFTSVSEIGLVFGAYFSGSRFNHTEFVSNTRTLAAPTPWSPGGVNLAALNFRPFVYSGANLDKTLLYKMAFLFEYTDPVAGVGYRRTVMVPFTKDETLLVRAEAKAMLKNFDEALIDLNLWTSSFYKGVVTTTDEINSFYDAIPYSSEETISPKVALSPAFVVDQGLQENMIQYVLHCRRVLTLHEGLRWFDIKRYGIEVPRFQVQSDGSLKVLDVLVKGDERRALQLPQDVISAGIEKNPR